MTVEERIIDALAKLREVANHALWSYDAGANVYDIVDAETIKKEFIRYVIESARQDGHEEAQQAAPPEPLTPQNAIKQARMMADEIWEMSKAIKESAPADAYFLKSVATQIHGMCLQYVRENHDT